MAARPTDVASILVLIVGAVVVASLIGLSSCGSRAQEAKVDLALVLAADMSHSMKVDDLALQRQGYAEALQSPEFIQSVTSGFTGAVAVTYVYWAARQKVVVPWTRISGPESARRFASAVAQSSIEYDENVGILTDVRAMLDFSLSLFDSAPPALREIIDVSANGGNTAGNDATQGEAVAAVRADVLERGVTINVLVVSPHPSVTDYYAEEVAGGRSSFVIGVTDYAGFAEAIRRKLVLEVAQVQ